MVYERLEKDFQNFIIEEYLPYVAKFGTPNAAKARAMKEGLPIGLNEFIKMMNSLHFVNVRQISVSEEHLLTELWRLLGVSDDETVPAANILSLLAGIMNL